jgi:hypothetical protein
MRMPRSRRPSPAFVVSCMALFVALSGSALALQGRNTVASNDIIRGAVKRSDVAIGAINSGRVANRTLRQIDFAPGTLLQGPQGEQGPPGPPGPPGGGGGGGAPGPDSITSDELAPITAIFSGSPTTVGGTAADDNWTGTNGQDSVSCPAGSQLISGYLEWTTFAFNDELAVAEVRLLDPGGAGTVLVRGIHDEASESFRAVALCLS